MPFPTERLIDWFQRWIYRPYLRARYFPAIHLSSRQGKDYIFCFVGEFGFEILCWIPYVKFIKETTGMYVRAAGRPGGQPLYSFADEYIELENFPRSDGLGLPESYREAFVRMKSRCPFICPLHFPLNNSNSRRICIDGYRYDIPPLYSRKFRPVNYSTLDVSDVQDELPFAAPRPIAVIANKSYTQFGEGIANYYSETELIALRDLLVDKGYFVVYNAYPEPKSAAHDEEVAIPADSVFENEHHGFHFGRIYRQGLSREKQNRLQISLYNQSSVVFATQGGTLYLPAICGKNAFFIMRQGRFNESRNLSSIYNVRLTPFYDVPMVLRSFDHYVS